MIPTQSKAKLPKTLSYPIGAEAVSGALTGAPHIDEFRLFFSDGPVWPASEFQRLLRDGLSYRIAEIRFEPARKPGRSAPNDLIEHGWYEGHWSITIYPVRRELRHVAGRLLRESGFPAVAEWLRLSEQTGWNTRRHRLSLVFDPTHGALSAEREDGV